jgi:uncharacterized protein (TIGR02246 family)
MRDHSDDLIICDYLDGMILKNTIMKKEPIVMVLLTLVCQLVFSQNEDIGIITNMNKDWLHSYVTKDTSALNRIFADDFVLVSHKGKKMSKKFIIENLAKQETVSVNVDSMDVKLLTGDVGVVTAFTTFVLNVDDKEILGQNCYQDVYVKREGKWLAVAAHVTLLSLK